MYLPALELHEATSLDDAVALLRRYAPDARVLAGGTDLLVDLKTGRSAAGHLVSIRGIDGLRGVSETSDGLLIGALTTLSELDASPAVAARYPVIRDATGRMAAPQIRNCATVGGNIAGAVPCADLPPVLMVCAASVLLWSPAGRRQVALPELCAGPRETNLGPDELLTAVLVPAPPAGFGAAYARFALRDGNAIAVAAVAAGLEIGPDGLVRDARIALGAVAPTPTLVGPAGHLLVGTPADEDAIDAAAVAAMNAARPISDVRGSAEFRRGLVATLARRAIRQALARAAETPA